MTSEEYGQYIDDFELGADVMPGESLTEYIERRRREFESKADGGSIGIEVLFGPKREDFSIGGRAKRKQTFDPKASVADYARALQSVGGGTDAQKRADLSRYIQSYTPKSASPALATAAQFAQGILGVDLGTPQTKSMTNFLQKTIQDKIAQSGKLSGSIDYRDYGVQTGPKGQHPYGKGDVSFNSPEFALATTLGKADYTVDPKTGKVTFTGGTAYDFPEQSLPFGLAEFINKGGVFGKKLDYSPNVTLGSDFMKQFNQPKYPDYLTAARQSEFYKNNPSALDPDLFRAAYARALPNSGIKTKVLSDGQIYTDYGNYDPSRVYSAYMSNRGTSSSNPFFDQFKGSQYADMPAIMKAMYGAPGNLNPYYADGGRVRMVSGGALKGLMSLFKRGSDDAVDLVKQEEIFREGPITTKFLEDVDDKLIKKFVRTRDTGGVGGYGMYDSFDDMPAGLKAAELISRIKKKGGGINYEAAELFLGKKLKGNESVDELIDIMLKDSPQLEKPIDDFYNYVLNPEKKADGGRVGLFMGGPALEGQALQIYNSMKNYNFTDQEIADALSARGLYTPGGTTQPEQVTGIINQQIQTGGGRDDNKTGFGKFGNLDPTTERTFVKDVYTIDRNAAPGAPLTGSFKPTEVTGYKNVNTGNYQTLEGKNINHGGINFKPAFAALMEAVGFGEKNLTGLPYKEGQIAGTFTGKKLSDFNPLNLFKKQQATLAEINAMNKKAVDELRAKQEAERQAELQRKIAAEAAAGKSLSQIGRENFTGEGQAFEKRKDTFTGGKTVKSASTPGGYYSSPRKDGGLMFADGGLATMFTRRR